MVELQQLTRYFGDFCAVDQLSARISPGEIVGFLGPNGAGKSTTMKMISGFLSPSSGDALVCGHSVVQSPLEVKKVLGYLPEGAPAWPEMTPLAFLDFIADIRGLTAKVKKQRLNAVIEQLQLEAVLDRPIENLSKGFKRRVGLAQAILHDPAVLILDEPTDGLDPNQKQQVRELIRNLSADKIVIVSTHILEEVSAVCNRAMIISAGKLVFDGTPAELEQQSPVHGAVTLTLTEVEKASACFSSLADLARMEMVGEQQLRLVPTAGKPIITAVLDCIHQHKLTVLDLHTHQGQLDAVFRQLTQQEMH